MSFTKLSDKDFQSRSRFIDTEKKFDAKFDIFFLDPPFADNSFLQNLRYIRQKKIFKKNHIIILHREKNSKDDLSGIINTLLIKIYGRSKIIFAKFL